MVVSCCVIGCAKRFDKVNPNSFYCIPKKPEERRKLWISAIKRVDWEPKDHDRVCSLHFVTGSKSNDQSSPDYVPSVNMGYDTIRHKNPEQRKARYLRAKKREAEKEPVEMETLMPATCQWEFFQISVDLVKGNTIVSGTQLGKQFVLTDLCKIFGVNIFVAFLNFCRESVKQDAQATMCIVPVPSITTPTTEAVTPMTKPSTVTPISKATTVTPDTSSLQFLFPLVLNPASTHHFETNTQLQSDGSLKRSIIANMTCGDVTSNNCSLQQETNAASDDTQFSAGNNLLPSELDQNVKKNNVTMMEQEEDVSIENSETILIKQESEWEDQERGEGVHGEVTQNFTHGSCTKDVKEGSLGAPESDTRTENENNLLELSENYTESNENLRDLSFSTRNSLLPSEWYQGVPKNDSNTESNETILIKKEPEWEDQERGMWVHGEVTQDSFNGSCTKDVEERSFKAPESDTCTDYENNFLEPSENTTEGNEDLENSSNNTRSSESREDPKKPSENTDESDEDFWESSESSRSTESDEDLWEPPEKMTKAERDLFEPSNCQLDEKEESAEIQETGICSRENSIYKMQRPGRLISSHRRENTLLKLEKAREDEKNKHEDEKEPREGEGINQTELPACVPCKILKCHCGETFKSQKELVKHGRQNHKTTMKLCEHCGQFQKSKSYHMHMQTHLPKYQKKKYQCAVCGVSYTTSNGLKTHIEVVHDGIRLKCRECNKQFCFKEALKRHQLSKHMNMLNHTCVYCGKKFVSKNCMQKHMRVHTGEKPYTCEYCGEKFNHNVSRKNHIRKAHPGKEITNLAKSSSH